MTATCTDKIIMLVDCQLRYSVNVIGKSWGSRRC